MQGKSKIVNDPIHGHIRLERYQLDVIDTPQFQRLRDLKQVGTTYLVFPGASHNRFEHCIGTSYLAGEWLLALQQAQPELGINEHDLKMIRIAGLCHDLGHGPFSHAFEEWIHKVRPDRPDYKHEQMSVSLLELLIEENGLDYSPAEITLIADLIRGKPSEGVVYTKRFMFDIVSNDRNSIDVDKFDYIARDCYNLGMKSSLDHTRLIKFSRVIDDKICFHAKEAFTLYELFHTRYSLWKQVYSHRVGKSIEYMIGDAFSMADQHIDPPISQAIDDPRVYSLLNDTILRVLEASRSEDLAPCRALIRRIRKRDIYPFINEVLLTGEQYARVRSEVTPEMICGYSAEEQLRPEHIRLHCFSINFAMKEQNPVDRVDFFRKWDATECYQIPKAEVSLLIPERFAEYYIRIFCTDQSLRAATHEAFNKMVNGFIRVVQPNRAHDIPPSPLKTPHQSQDPSSAPTPTPTKIASARPLHYQSQSPAKRFRST